MQNNFLFLFSAVFFIFSASVQAKPYPDPKRVPKLSAKILDRYRVQSSVKMQEFETTAAIRVTVALSADKAGSETFKISEMVKENSGTPALALRSRTQPKWGSFIGILESRDSKNGISRVQRFDSIGTGHLFKLLNRELSFRFPEKAFSSLKEGGLRFRLVAENSKSGLMQEVYRRDFEFSDLAFANGATDVDTAGNVEIREIKASSATQFVQMVVYSEGYLANERDLFFSHANRIPNVFENYRFPGFENIRILAAFNPSAKKLTSAQNLGMPIPKFDTWLGLYFPYWMNFGRWYHVTYPTREQDFRKSLATVPYDYPVALVHSSEYWGVGNYKSHTAVPAKNGSFGYLLMHEFGHFMGLNEEYDGGGRTELEFAPLIREPWSQNLTFLRDPSQLKWKKHVHADTPIPTASSFWSSSKPQYGAYKGGYGDSEPIKESYIPGFHCVMESGANFCPICAGALREMIDFDRGHLLGKN